MREFNVTFALVRPIRQAGTTVIRQTYDVDLVAFSTSTFTYDLQSRATTLSAALLLTKVAPLLTKKNLNIFFFLNDSGAIL